MAALAAPREITRLIAYKHGFSRDVPVKATPTKIYHGALVVKTAGAKDAAPATAAGSLIAIGVADLEGWDDQTGASGQASTSPSTRGISVTGGAADGDRKIMVQFGVFKFLNKAGDLVDAGDIGDLCYIEDDQTVRITAAGTSAAGKVIAVDPDGGVFVEVGI